MSLSTCPGVGNRPPSENKIANSGGMPGGGGEMVTGRIEPCINANFGWSVFQINFYGKESTKNLNRSVDVGLPQSYPSLSRFSEHLRKAI